MVILLAVVALGLVALWVFDERAEERSERRRLRREKRRAGKD